MTVYGVKNGWVELVEDGGSRICHTFADTANNAKSMLIENGSKPSELPRGNPTLLIAMAAMKKQQRQM